jgi:photosystem II stability/assembly factor-like uncharacterized protein
MRWELLLLKQNGNIVFCQVCGEEIGPDEVVYCQNCSTPHHLDCWNYVGWCSTYGCGCTIASAQIYQFDDDSSDLLIVENPDDLDVERSAFPRSSAIDPFRLSLQEKPTYGSLRVLEPSMSGMPLDVYNLINSLPGNLVHPKWTWFDTTSGPLMTILGVFLLPAWILAYGILLAFVIPFAAILVSLMACADFFFESFGLDFRFAVYLDGLKQKSAAKKHFLQTSQDWNSGSPLQTGGLGLFYDSNPERVKMQLCGSPVVRFSLDGAVLLKDLKIRDCCFINDKTGIAIIQGEEKYRHTDDGGYNWLSYSLPIEGRGLKLASSAGKGKKNLWMFSSAGQMATSCDGGNSWERRLEDFYEIVDCSFFSASNGFLLAKERDHLTGKSNSVLFRTTDGGHKWAVVYGDGGRKVYIPGAPVSLYFMDDMNGWIGEVNGLILITDSGGRQWKQDSGYLKSSVVSVCFTGEGLGIAAGSDGNTWVRAKGEWIETDNPLVNLPGWHLRSLREAGEFKLSASCSKGLLFFNWNT